MHEAGIARSDLNRADPGVFGEDVIEDEEDIKVFIVFVDRERARMRYGQVGLAKGPGNVGRGGAVVPEEAKSAEIY